MDTNYNSDKQKCFGIRSTRASRVLMYGFLTVFSLVLLFKTCFLAQSITDWLWQCLILIVSGALVYLFAYLASLKDRDAAKKEILDDALRLESEQFFNKLLSKLIKSFNFTFKLIGIFISDLIFYKSFFVFSVVREKLGIIDVNLTNRLIPTPINTLA